MSRSKRNRSKNLYAKWTGRCYWCKVKILNISDFAQLKLHERHEYKIATKDHILPTAEGGTDRNENKEFACSDCNQARTLNQTAEIKAALRCPLIRDKLKLLRK